MRAGLVVCPDRGEEARGGVFGEVLCGARVGQRSAGRFCGRKPFVEAPAHAGHLGHVLGFVKTEAAR